ncbi:MAG: alkyl hydroperoxide reductase [Chloroflexi bacterium]|nr:alkyl hydroperoxide reductase [Chloroflexota bacterium]MCY3938936.1 alkyl hydroperoxide reductase [Chloroflexota bacterium]
MRKLERRFPNELAVVGVHSAKFDAERATEHVLSAVRRYRVEHPVVNDARFEIWQSYAVRAWPTLMFIDPTGRVIGKHEGEFDADVVTGIIEQMVDEFRSRGLLNSTPMPALASDTEAAMLRYPGKILVDEPTGRIFISDSNNDRIVVSDLAGNVLTVTGGAETGLTDGGYDVSEFNQPQGMELTGEILYVADTGNHAIRRVDLDSQVVSTVAGPDEGLRSPWDLTLHNNELYAAMAGSHQLWRIDPDSGAAWPYAGTGGESIQDGPLGSALLAQPSGIVSYRDRLYFVDSETSSVRFAAGGEIGTVVGTGLFDFGDVDGEGDAVRLQHPIGMAAGEAGLFIVDSYNHKIKSVGPARRAVAAVAGDGVSGHVDGPLETARFSEPSGLSVGSGRIWVADTNNHAVRVIDLDRRTVDTLEVQGL